MFDFVKVISAALPVFLTSYCEYNIVSEFTCLKYHIHWRFEIYIDTTRP